MIVILIGKDSKLKFYDIYRQKFVAKCDIENVKGFYVVGDDVIIGIRENSKDKIKYKKIKLPFLPGSKDGDFLFYTAIDSVL